MPAPVESAPPPETIDRMSPPVPYADLAPAYICEGLRTFTPSVDAALRLTLQFPDRDAVTLDYVGGQPGGDLWSNGRALYDSGVVAAFFGEPFSTVRFGRVYAYDRCVPEVDEAPEGAVNRLPGLPALAFADVSPDSTAGAVFVRMWQDVVTFWASPPLLGVDRDQVVAVKVVDEYFGASVEVELAPDVGRQLEALTAERVGQPLGLFVDGYLVVAPIVQEPLRDGRLRLSGGFSRTDAEDLAARLRGD